MEGFHDLGQRIVQAARLAAAMHRYEARSGVATRSPQERALLAAQRILANGRSAIGGAGLVGGRLGRAIGDHDDDYGCNGLHHARLGDLVTDDERNGLLTGILDDDDDAPDR